MKKILATLTLLMACSSLMAQSINPPTALRTDLIEHTDRVFVNGRVSQLPLSKMDNIVESSQVAEIASLNPAFGWQMEDSRHNIKQQGYQIQLATTLDFETPLWDSGRVEGSTPQTRYAGAPLSPLTIYHWRVKVWDNHNLESEWSQPKAFKTAAQLKEYSSGYYPLMMSRQGYLTEHEIDPVTRLYDFGKAAFGYIDITVDSPIEGDTLTVAFGEVLTEQGRLNKRPGGARRYREVELTLLRGEHSYKVAIERDGRNTGSNAIAMPQYIGDVYPLRYCQVVSRNGATVKQLNREVVNYPFDDYASHFESSNTLLNEIWEFCKYSIKATSFTGLYVDGDRERIPYEADVYINEMCHYGVDSEYTIGRRSNEFLLFNPTWPTEWILTSVLLAWSDYLYSGNADFINYYIDDIEAKCLTALLDDNGLISTTTGKLTDDVKRTVHYTKRERMRDIVDWPHKGTLGLSGDDSGETDGFDFTPYNTVVNAYFNKALRVMSQMALSAGDEVKSAHYATMAEQHYKAFNALLFDKERGYYTDGADSEHSSLHANMFALAFDLVPQRYVESVTAFVKSRGMACSVYGSQHLLDAIYAGEDGDYGLSLLTSTDDRGWYHAIYNIGTTISLEAWDNKYKPNQDWNHAWGAAPANIIPMRLMGVQPLTAGFGVVRIKPQIADLEWAELRYPTIRGEIALSIESREHFTMELSIPANMEAEVWIPSPQKGTVLLDGERVKAKRVRDFYLLDEPLGSGEYRIELK